MKEELKRLIQQNKLSEALDNLNRMALDEYSQNTLLMLQSRFNRLEKDKHAGVISRGDEAIEYNRIVASILHLIDELKIEQIQTKASKGIELSVDEIVSKTILYCTTYLKHNNPFNHNFSSDMKLLWEKYIKPFFLTKDSYVINGLERNPSDIKLQTKLEVRLEDALLDDNGLRQSLLEQIYRIELVHNKEKLSNKSVIAGNDNMIIQGVNGSNIYINYPKNQL